MRWKGLESSPVPWDVHSCILPRASFTCDGDWCPGAGGLVLEFGVERQNWCLQMRKPPHCSPDLAGFVVVPCYMSSSEDLEEGGLVGQPSPSEEAVSFLGHP